MRLPLFILTITFLALSPALSARGRASSSRRARPLRVALIAGTKSHGPGTHEYEKGCRLLADCLQQAANLRSVQAEVYTGGWPANPTALDGVDTIVVFCDGSDHSEKDHPLLQGDRLATLGSAMRRGAGLVVLHYTLFVPQKRGGPEFTEWVGGCFDYETGTGSPPWYSRIQTASTVAVPASPSHPISRGLAPFALREEYYYHMRFREPDQRRVDILTTSLPNEPVPEVVAWAVERPDGGRGFAFTGGHFHDNWRVDSVRRMVLNAVVWTGRGEVPPGGVASTLPRAEAEEARLRPAAASPPPLTEARSGDSVDWPNVGYDRGGTRCSPLKQITAANVSDLRVAWTYHTGDANAAANTTIECTPIVVEGVMYLTTVRTRVVALDAASGREIWLFDPYASPRPAGVRRGSPGVNRGVAFWSDERPDGERRILLGTADGRLISLDARTGRPDPRFGTQGEVDLHQGLDRDIGGLAYGATSAPAVWADRVILGFLTGEAQPSAPGDVRAFDVRTGRQAWQFHTVPRPGEPGNDTWAGESWRDRGGANAWGGFTVDSAQGIVFAGTGSAASDFYGGDRKGTNLFANCTLALDARTGRRLWHFQAVRHDLWDFDNPCPPVVVTVRQGGRPVEAVAQVTKTGCCYLLDRKTGRPLFGVEERAVPGSDIPGEEAAATQIFPLKPPPFSRQAFTDADATDIEPAAREAILTRLRTLRHGPIYTPPSLQGSVNLPGFHGGATWSGASFDPARGLLFVNSNNIPWVSQLRRNEGGGYDFTGYTYFTDPQGYPAVKPPWGQLNAIDLNRGEIAWQVPLGEYPELRAKGLPPTGTENFGGTIVSAGGLVWIGGSKDAKFHAFDAGTGRLLWEYALPAGGYATPCTYSVNGRQFVAIAAGGGGKPRTAPGDAFVAFALP